MKTLILAASTLAVMFSAGAAFANGTPFSTQVPADIFVLADRNHDGHLSPRELERAQTLMFFASNGDRKS